MSGLKLEQRESLVAQLNRQQAWLCKAIQDEKEQSSREHYADLAGTAPDEGDEAVADVLTDIENAVIARHLSELSDIEAARQRIAAGSYGVCVDCGQDIAYDRLAAYPTAKRCAACQGLYERLYAAAPHSTL